LKSQSKRPSELKRLKEISDANEFIEIIKSEKILEAIRNQRREESPLAFVLENYKPQER